MTKMKTLFGAALLALAAGTAEAANTIKIGEINSYARMPQFLDPYKMGWELAVDEINAWGGMRAVNGVGFTLDAGHILALIGPNGAGKTTCCIMLNGRLRPDAGRILLAGVDVTGFPPRRIWRRGVGRTFQIAATFASMTVLENIQTALISHHERPAAMAAAGQTPLYRPDDGAAGAGPDWRTRRSAPAPSSPTAISSGSRRSILAAAQRSASNPPALPDGDHYGASVSCRQHKSPFFPSRQDGVCMGA